MSTAQTKKNQALGKGIRALLSDIDIELSTSGEALPAANHSIERIPLSHISTNPKQPRKDFPEGALLELSESIKLHDVIQPVTVVKTGINKYQLISGERRLRASKMAGLKDIPAYIRTANDQEMLELSLLENLQREDLNAIEIAISYRRLMDECSLNQEQVAERMKKERSTVTNYLRLLKLPPDIQKAVRDGLLSMGHARAITGLSLIDQQLFVLKETLEKQLSVRQVEQLVKSFEKETPHKFRKKIVLMPPYYGKLQDNISSHFSTQVSLNKKKNGSGDISITFINDKDLERILKMMNFTP